MMPGAPSDQIRRIEPPGRSGLATLTMLLIVVVVVAALYFGREIFVPMALAILLAFALALPVRWLRRLGLGRVPAVIVAVSLAFVALLAFGLLAAGEIGRLAAGLPSYQRNLEAKIQDFRDAPPGGQLFQRLSEMLQGLDEQINPPPEAQPAEPAATPTTAEPAPEPVPVVIEEPEPPALEVVQRVITPLIGPLATTGIVIVFVIFVLLQREDLRDRLIRLAGTGDLQRTTQALDDAAKRVGRYLLMQLAINIIYGVPVGIGLWLLGIPSPMLWGMLAILLRFVPYIGPLVVAAFPLALALAVDPGWGTLVWTALLFIGLELVVGNVVEPWLYGSSTGMSPVAVIVAAIFWTWLWGPIGLLLSTPLTVCMVVLGRHVPQLAFLDIMLGNQPVLSPAETLYQRLLAGDLGEAIERAEEFLVERPLAAFYDEVAIPALVYCEHDRRRGVLNPEQRAVVADGAIALIEYLAEHDDVTPEAATGKAPAMTVQATALAPPPAAREGVTLCVAGRGNLDEAAARMLAQLLERSGLAARVVPFEAVRSMTLVQLDTSSARAVCLSYLNPDSFAQARYLVRRFRARIPDAAVIVGFWGLISDEPGRREPVAATQADAVAVSLQQAVTELAGVLARRVSDG